MVSPLTPEEIIRIHRGEAPIPKGLRVIVPGWQLKQIYPDFDDPYRNGRYATVLSEPETPAPEQIQVLVDGKEEPVMVQVWGLLL